MGSITGKVNSFLSSSAGKNKIKGLTGGGNGTVDLEERRKEMILAAQGMVALLKQHAASAGLPASVMAHVESFAASAPTINDDGSGFAVINMGSDPTRPSLCPERYGGVHNIVALFNNGYEASASVYGKWEGHGDVEGGSAFIKSRPQRGGLGFMQSAVADFNGKYGSKYNVIAVLGGPYG